ISTPGSPRSCSRCRLCAPGLKISWCSLSILPDAFRGAIAEEIEDMGRRERRSLYTRCVRLIEHLLKWRHQPERRGKGWSQTIFLQRKGIRRMLNENPSLKPDLAALITEAYDEAAGSASIVTASVANRIRCKLPVD